MIRFCGFDCETMGFDAKKDRIIEIAALIFDTDGKMFFPVDRFTALVHETGFAPLTSEIEDITGIKQAHLVEHGLLPGYVFPYLHKKLEALKVQVMMAHNAPFDKGFLDSELEKLGLKLELPWVCTIKDIDHPKKFKCKKLSHLALDYGIAVDPAELHRAEADVLLMLKLIEAANLDFEYLFERSKVPDVTIRACIPSPFGAGGDGGVGKDKAASLGFRWQGDRKIWTKTVKEDMLGKEEQELGYKVAII